MSEKITVVGETKLSDVRILGIDPSLTSTGYAVIDLDGKLKFCDTIKTKSNENLFDRWDRIVNTLIQIAFVNACTSVKPFVYMEGYPYGMARRGGGHIFGLAELGGIIKYEFRTQKGTEIQVVATQTAKKAATGKGNAKKEQVRAALQEKYSILEEKVSLDITDAIAVALAGREKILNELA